MGSIIKNYTQPAFLICAVVLAVAGGGMTLAVNKFEMYLTKEPLPLKKSLSLLDEDKLSGYKVVKKTKIKNEEVVESLGTEDYIQWVLDDTNEPDDSPVRRSSLFITYYQLPDRVPHVPEECYAGSGLQRQSSQIITLNVGEANDGKQMEVNQLVFSARNPDYLVGGTEFSVFYCLNVNGVYACGRTEARTILNKNIFGKYSYFCKIEWFFFDGRGVRTNPPLEQVMTATGKLLSTVLPLLEQEHWPDYRDR